MLFIASRKRRESSLLPPRIQHGARLPRPQAQAAWSESSPRRQRPIRCATATRRCSWAPAPGGSAPGPAHSRRVEIGSTAGRSSSAEQRSHPYQKRRHLPILQLLGEKNYRPSERTRTPTTAPTSDRTDDLPTLYPSTPTMDPFLNPVSRKPSRSCGKSW